MRGERGVHTKVKMVTLAIVGLKNVSVAVLEDIRVLLSNSRHTIVWPALFPPWALATSLTSFVSTLKRS
jgi:hypothetical protein